MSNSSQSLKTGRDQHRMRAGLKEIFDLASELLRPYLAQILHGCDHDVLVLVGKGGRIDFFCATGANAAQNVEDKFSYVFIAMSHGRVQEGDRLRSLVAQHIYGLVANLRIFVDQ